MIQAALDSQYSDYFFLGKEKNAEGKSIINVETSKDIDAVKALFAELQMADPDFKWWLLEATSECFQFAEEEEYDKFHATIKRVKHLRYVNARHGRLKTVSGNFLSRSERKKNTEISTEK